MRKFVSQSDASSQSVSASGSIGRWVAPGVLSIVLVGGLLTFYLMGERAIGNRVAADSMTRLKGAKQIMFTWIEFQEQSCRAVADLPEMGKLGDRIRASDGSLQQEKELIRLLDFHKTTFQYLGYHLADSRGVIAVASDVRMHGSPSPLSTIDLNGILADHPGHMIMPFRSAFALPNKQGDMESGMVCSYVASPIRDSNGEVVGYFAWRIDPDLAYARILDAGRSGETGETFTFNKDGVLQSKSRFPDRVAESGLFIDAKNSETMLNVRLGSAEGGPQPGGAESVVGSSKAYQSYLGEQVAGAWEWMPRHEFGIVSEIDVAEAYGPLKVFRLAIHGVLGMCLIYYVVVLAYTARIRCLNRDIREAQRKNERLGQYRLIDKVGEGGMGEVYRAEHAFLKRPTAVKMIRYENATEEGIARFEREVQLTSTLSHPNTIAIYDYGRTGSGVFYYAMEFLDGLSLKEVVERFGPLPPDRVIHILRQACGSLHEAHERGLIHRDIKPANLMLCVRGGIADRVKVLDFGLVKDVTGESDMAVDLTNPGQLAGTPCYLSPEAIGKESDLDGRSDLYLLGAVGYYLLTGSHAFNSKTVPELLRDHLQNMPDTPSERLGRQVPADLQSIIMLALAKDPKDRPSTAQAMADALAMCEDADGWTRELAEGWWEGLRSKSATGKKKGEGIHDVDPTVVA